MVPLRRDSGHSQTNLLSGSQAQQRVSLLYTFLRAAALRQPNLLRHQSLTVDLQLLVDTQGRGVSALHVCVLYVGIEFIVRLGVDRVAHLRALRFAPQARRALAPSGLPARRAMLTLATGAAASIADLLLGNVEHAFCNTFSQRFGEVIGTARVLQSRQSVPLDLLFVTDGSQELRLLVKRGRLHVAYPRLVVVPRVATLLAALLRALLRMQSVDAGVLRLEARLEARLETASIESLAVDHDLAQVLE